MGKGKSSGGSKLRKSEGTRRDLSSSAKEGGKKRIEHGTYPYLERGIEDPRQWLGYEHHEKNIWKLKEISRGGCLFNHRAYRILRHARKLRIGFSGRPTSSHQTDGEGLRKGTCTQ